MSFPEFLRPSPNCANAPVHERRGVAFHNTVESFAETLALILDPARQISYHVVIDRDGTRCTSVPDEAIAWHAGASSFLGRTRCNDFLLGAAFVGDTYREPLSDAQLRSALEWLRPRWTRHRWTLAHMTDHRQIAPGRKSDLNPVEWERLRNAIAAEFCRSSLT